jgi:hypothetical protein
MYDHRYAGMKSLSKETRANNTRNCVAKLGKGVKGEETENNFLLGQIQNNLAS